MLSNMVIPAPCDFILLICDLIFWRFFSIEKPWKWTIFFSFFPVTQMVTLKNCHANMIWWKRTIWQWCAASPNCPALPSHLLSSNTVLFCLLVCASATSTPCLVALYLMMYLLWLKTKISDLMFQSQIFFGMIFGEHLCKR